ncbi:hypothetical protein PA598K_02853 [Paenibacillus sp. 598K]|nr:hypothetical protein PA598K_02853 [Paenibacillus sp. 598K]
MKCPVCEDVRMREVEKDGVMIDVCPDCKGVWLDRGELDKLMAGVREMRRELGEWDTSSASPNSERSGPSVPSFGNGAPDYAGQRQPEPRDRSSSDGYGDQHGPNGPYHEQPRYDRDGYDQHGYDRHGYDRRGYDKHGYPYKRKKKKTVLDVFGDLFD